RCATASSRRAARRSRSIPRARLPDPGQVDTIEEPIITATILTKDEHVGAILKLCQGKRGIQKTLNYITTTRVMIEYEKVCFAQRPDWIVVVGDVNSTAACAMVGAKLCIPVAHLEAGLRSRDRDMPEEINRILTDHISNLLFAPTEAAVDNLLHEGVQPSVIHLVGDVMFDAIKFYQTNADRSQVTLKTLGLQPNGYILTTIHRAENTDNPERIKTIIDSLSELAVHNLIIFPVHPRTKAHLEKSEPAMSNGNLRLIEPVGYLEMIALQKNCKFIITDSGGMQKEAFLNQKFCLTVRDETEWVELVENGYNFLATPLSSLVPLAEQISGQPFPNRSYQPYGDGHAAEKLVKIILNNI
ncbi:MAG: UDP-N-acetylglucosamine 2-epimerase (non-hydrolyzing), partial [Bacteroidia bacterium]|nr:UDP-N-acetylglucosamine 2-epimerase (non-hydrolyzing) [Bacteroidia bacterium]